MIDILIDIKGSVANVRSFLAGNAHEHNIRQLVFTTDWPEEAIDYTGEPLIKTIVFVTPRNIALAPAVVIDNKVSLEDSILDGEGTLLFTIYGKVAGLLAHNASGALQVSAALDDLGGVAPEVYVDVTSECIAAKEAALAVVAREESIVADATEQAGLSAGSAEQAANNILNGVDTHNTSLTAHADIREEIRTVEAIARGRATAFVFDNLTAMNNWLAIPENVAQLVVGDNLYIRALNVKDRWWDGTQVQMLESEAPDLTNYYLKTQVDALLPIHVTRAEYNTLIAAGTVQAGRDYDVTEA